VFDPPVFDRLSLAVNGKDGERRDFKNVVVKILLMAWTSSKIHIQVAEKGQ